MKVAVVGGGLAGLAAALELVDQGHAVTLYEARPTLGGAVQTLPEREGDPSPPPDNGQHIALGCFTEYLRFLDRVGEGRSYRRLSLDLPVIAGDGRVATIGRSAASFLRYRHLSLVDRLRVARAVRRLPQRGSSTQTFGALLRELGCSDESIESFWDVFVRPALNLRTDEVSAEWGVFTVRTALLSSREASDVVLPTRPLGWMHGDAAGRALEAAGATVRTDERVVSLDDLDADAIVVATPPAEAARLLDEPDPALEHSPIVSVHLLFDRPLLAHPLAALLDTDAHWVFDRGATYRAGTRRGASVFDGGVERRARADGYPRPRARRPDRRAARRAARRGRASLVARQPRAGGDAGAAPGRRTAARRDRPPERRPRRRLGRDRVAGDDGGSRAQRCRSGPCADTLA